MKKCKERKTGRFLAAKFIEVNGPEERSYVTNEVEIMKNLQHPRLLQLYDAFERKDGFCIVTELWVNVISDLKAKSRKYQGIFKVKSRVKTWQVRGIWSQQLEHKQIPKRGTESGVRKGKRSLLASHTRCKCSMETTYNSVKVKLGIKVLKWVESLIGWEVTVGKGSECH